MKIPRVTTKEAVRHLKAGGLVVYPTENAYALGCDATNARAVSRIFVTKQRDARKPVATIAASISLVKKFFVFEGPSRRLALEHWPTSLTLVLTSRDHALRRALGPEVGVRISPNPVARALSRALGAPIVSTSANRSGGPSCWSIRAVERSLGATEHDIVAIDAGALPRRLPSTVVRIAKNGTMEVLRAGAVRLKQTLAVQRTA